MRVVSVHRILTEIGQFAHVHEIGTERNGPQIVVAQELLVVNNLGRQDGCAPDERIRPIGGPRFTLLSAVYGPTARSGEA